MTTIHKKFETWFDGVATFVYHRKYITAVVMLLTIFTLLVIPVTQNKIIDDLCQS